jgi:hypothetical protein
MHRSSTSIRRFAVGVFCLAWVGVIRCAAQNPIAIPGPNEGYQITPIDSSQAAPAGYEGRTETSTKTAVGITPATAGKRIVAKFTLGNQIRTCPNADGTVDGEGVFSVSIDYTNKQANGTSTLHIEMMTKGKYKGQVGDNALLQGPVDGQFDYTYTQTAGTRDQSGNLSTPPSNVHQHITLPIVVMTNLKPPDLGAFSG